MNLFYSTPSMYVDAVSKTDTIWPVKYDDMFPYADNEHSFWTGFFSSRAVDKHYTRSMSANFRASQQLFTQKMYDQNLSTPEAMRMNAGWESMMNALGIN